MQVTEKIADVIIDLQNEARYYEVLAFISNAQEAAIEARGSLTKEQSWDLFAALQEFKCIIDELAVYKNHAVPTCLGLYKEEEVGEL